MTVYFHTILNSLLKKNVMPHQLPRKLRFVN